MNKSLLILSMVFVLLLCGVNAAVSVNSGFSDGTSLKEITDSESASASFWVYITSDKGREFIDVSLRDLEGGLIKTFEDRLLHNGLFYKEYTINKEHYKTPGQYKIHVYSQDSESEILKEDLRLVVNEKPAPENHAPVIQDIVNQEKPEGEDFSYQIVASDEDGDSLDYILVAGPDGMGIDKNGLITWKDVVEGIYSIKVSVSDSVNPAVERSFVLTVNPKSQPSNKNPILVIKLGEKSIEKDIRVDDGVTLVLSLASSSDEDGDELSYDYVVRAENPNIAIRTELNLPINKGFSLTPTATALSYGLEFTVKDGKGGSDSKTIKVVVNQPEEPEEPTEPTEPEEPELEPEPQPEPEPEGRVEGDFNFDGVVDSQDFLIFAGEAWGTKEGDENWDARFDLDKNKEIGFGDFIEFVRNFGKETGLTFRFINEKTGEEVNKIEIKENEDFKVRVEIRKEGQSGLMNFDYVESELAVERYGVVSFKGDTNYNSVEHPLREKEFKVKVGRKVSFEEYGTNKLEKTLIVKVKDVNRAPKNLQVREFSPKEPRETDSIRIVMGAEDEDGDKLSYSVDKKFSVDGNVLSWETGYEDEGEYEITIKVEDGFDGEDTYTRIIFVKERNRLPELKVPGDIKVQEGMHISGGIHSPARGNKVEFEVSSDKDPEGDEVEISLESELPKGASFENGKINWDLRKNQGRAEPYEFRFRLSDGKDAVEKIVKVFVEDNVWPYYPDGVEASKPEAVVGLISYGIKDGKAMVTISAENSRDKQDFKQELEYRYDFENDGVWDSEWERDVLESRVTHFYSEEDERFFRGGIGYATVRVEVRDLDGMISEGSETIRIDKKTYVKEEEKPEEEEEPEEEVEVNHAPHAVDDSVVVDEDSVNNKVDVLGNDYDVDDDVLVIESVGQASHGSVSHDGSFVYYSPDADYFGEDSFSYAINDGELEDSGVVIVDVKNVNDAPNAVDDSVAVNEDTTNNQINVLANDYDVDDDVLVIESVGQASHGSVSHDGSFVYYSPDADYFGSDSFTYVIKDGKGGSDSASVTINIGNVNDAPVLGNLEKGVRDINEDVAYSHTYSYSDVDGDSVVWGLDSGGADFLSLSQEGVLSGTPGNEDVGSYNIKVSIDDGKGGVDSQSFTLKVINVNDAPVVADILDQTIKAGESFAAINLDSFVSDVDNKDEEISWSVSGNVNLIVQIINRVAIITAPSGFVGSETLKFTASDPSGASDSDNAIFSVQAAPKPVVNQPPIVADIPDQTIGFKGSFATIDLDSFVSDDTTLDEQIQWSVSGDVNLVVSIDANRVASVEYNEFVGSETITFTARDLEGASGSDSARFTINPNNNPVLTIKKEGVVIEDGMTIDIKEGEALILNLIGGDVDGDELKYEVLNRPESAVLKGGVFSWTPSNTQGGREYSLTFRVLDLDNTGQLKGGSDSKTIIVSVKDVLEPVYRAKKRAVHHLEVKSVIVNNWQTVERGESFDIDVVVENKGNVKQKDVRVRVEIPQLEYYQRSSEFDIKKGKQEIVSFGIEMPREFSEEIVYAVVTVSNNKDTESEVIGFAVG